MGSLLGGEVGILVGPDEGAETIGDTVGIVSEGGSELTGLPVGPGDGAIDMDNENDSISI